MGFSLNIIRLKENKPSVLTKYLCYIIKHDYENIRAWFEQNDAYFISQCKRCKHRNMLNGRTHDNINYHAWEI